MTTIFAALQSQEKVSHYTPLGIRFWDWAGDVAVTEGLQVGIRPPARPDLQRRAFQTPSGIYAFRNLPGLRGLEASNPELPPGVHPVDSSPLQPQCFVVEVEDRLGRFLATTFQVDLPYRGIYPTRPAGSPLEPALPGFYLFSAPNRTVLAEMAVVRAQLVERLPDARTRPASHAVLEVVAVEPDGVPGSTPAVGIADEPRPARDPAAGLGSHRSRALCPGQPATPGQRRSSARPGHYPDPAVRPHPTHGRRPRSAPAQHPARLRPAIDAPDRRELRSMD